MTAGWRRSSLLEREGDRLRVLRAGAGQLLDVVGHRGFGPAHPPTDTAFGRRRIHVSADALGEPAVVGPGAGPCLGGATALGLARARATDRGRGAVDDGTVRMGGRREALPLEQLPFRAAEAVGDRVVRELVARDRPPCRAVVVGRDAGADPLPSRR